MGSQVVSNVGVGFRRLGALGMVVSALGEIMVVIGCSGHPATLPVRGLVRYKGEPLGGATVVFSGTHPKTGHPLVATGITDAAGKFELQSHFGPRDTLSGVILGPQRVTITKFVPPQGMSEERYEKLVQAERAAAEAKVTVAIGERAPPRVPLLGDEYSNVSKTTLSAEVVRGNKNEFIFDLR
jgi:hypothetical protein